MRAQQLRANASRKPGSTWRILSGILALVVFILFIRLSMAPVRESRVVGSSVIPVKQTYETAKNFKLMYGTAWKKARTTELVVAAARTGFRAFDTANQPAHYEESLVGDALSILAEQYGLPRDSLYIQTKYTPNQDPATKPPYRQTDEVRVQVEKSLSSSFKHLKTTYIDSVLLHSVFDYGSNSLNDKDIEAWAALSREKMKGTIGVIGVSNAQAGHLVELCKQEIKPYYIQNRCFMRTQWDRQVRDVARECGTIYQGFSLLTANRDATGPGSVVTAITEQLNAVVDTVKDSSKDDNGAFALKRVNKREVALGRVNADALSRAIRLAKAARAAGGRITPAQVIFRFAIDIGMLPVLGPLDPSHQVADLAAAWVMPSLTPAHVTAIEMNNMAFARPPLVVATPPGDPRSGGGIGGAAPGSPAALVGQSSPAGAVDGEQSEMKIGATTPDGLIMVDRNIYVKADSVQPRGVGYERINLGRDTTSSRVALNLVPDGASGGEMVEIEVLSPLVRAWTEGCAAQSGGCKIARAERVPPLWGIDRFRGPPYALVQFMAPADRMVLRAGGIKVHEGQAKGGLGGRIEEGSICLIPPRGEGKEGELGWYFVALAEHSEWADTFPVVGKVVSQLDKLKALAENGLGAHRLVPSAWGETAVVALEPPLPIIFGTNAIAKLAGGGITQQSVEDLDKNPRKRVSPIQLSSLIKL